MKGLLFNPITYWMRWVFTKYKYQIKYLGKHLKLEYLAEVKNSSFGVYNTVYKQARLRNTQLGDFSYVARDSQIYDATVGKFTSIGPNVSVGMGNHPSSVFVSTHPIFYSTIGQSSGKVIVSKSLYKEFLKTNIGNDVWIGNNVTIKPGVNIGNGAIIASGSVVTKDIKPYSIVGGVPAKIIKYRFTEEQVLFLEEFKWWDKGLFWLEKNKDLFLNIEYLMEKNKR